MKSEQNIPDWNKDSVWKNVEEKLRQKKKRRFIYWPFMGTIGAILLIGFLTWIYNVQLIDNSLHKNFTPKSEQKTNPEEIQNEFPLDSTIVLDKNSMQVPEPNTVQIKFSTSNEQRLPKNNIITSAAGIQSEELVISATNLKSKNNTYKDAITQHSPFEKIISKSVVTNTLSTLDPLAKLSIDLSPINIYRIDSLWNKNFNYSLPQNNKKQRTPAFWWVENGLSFGKKSFVNLNEQTIGRNSTEQFRFMHTSAIGIQKFLNQNWSLKLGLAYQTIYEKYEHSSSFVEEEEIFSDEAKVYELLDGITYFEAGLTTQRTTSTRYIIHNNFIHRLSIPLEFAYTFNNDYWSLEPSLGLRFQYFHRFDGIISEEEYHFFDLDKINDTYYPNDIRMGLITSLNLKYDISQKVSLGLRFTYEKDDFLNLAKSDFFSRYETLSLQLGYYHSLGSF